MKKKNKNTQVDLKKKRVIDNYKKNYNKLSFREKQLIQLIDKKDIPIYLSLFQAKRKRLINKALRKSGLTEMKVINFLKKEKQREKQKEPINNEKKEVNLNSTFKPDNNSLSISFSNKTSVNSDGTISLSKNTFINKTREKENKDTTEKKDKDKKATALDNSAMILKRKNISKFKKILGRALELEALSVKQKEQSVNEQKNFVLSNVISNFKNKGIGVVGRLIAVIIGKLVGALVALVASIISLFWPLIVAIMVVTTIVASIISFFKIEEDMQYKENQALLGSQSFSQEVEQYRDKVYEELAKHGREDYTDLLLAQMQQESGGDGPDVMQCAESLGKTHDEMTVDESISHACELMSNYMDRTGVSKIDDMDNIRLSLQAYNYGSNFLDWLEKAYGKLFWDGKFPLEYQALMSYEKRDPQSAKRMGPYKYGDAYYTTHVLKYYHPANKSASASVDTVKDIDTEERVNFLFPDGVPTNEIDMRKHMVTITVPILDKNGNDSTMLITVHEKLQDVIYEGFKQMKEIGFPIDSSQTAGYCYRQMSSDSSKLSHHSYGSCIDINWNSNPATYTGGIYAPFSDPLSITPEVVSIWAKLGFYWGGYWTGYYTDYMHFTYTGC